MTTGMITQLGHFEVLSELSKSATGAVYKANDPRSGQTVALKAIQLSAFGASAGELEECLLAEAEATKVLNNPNLTAVFGAGEIDGRFCAAMEYIQGNSVQTMLERKEGFSIWDLLDIGRQACAGLDDAHAQKVFHYSLEPAKIMCGWDGGVRILSFGASSVGKFTAQVPGVPSFLYYMSPEQVHEGAIDGRSNIFSMGAMFYEMATERKAFDGENAASVRRSILANTPVPPAQLNPKLHPVLSQLIMKALAKDPKERYQTGRQLLDDLEQCKESKPQVVKTVVAPIKVSPVTAAVAGVPAEKKMAAASSSAAQPAMPRTHKPTNSPSASMSSAGLDEDRVATVTAPAPKISVDPTMAFEEKSGKGVSFSEMTELPPLKEIYVAPPPPPSLDAPALSEFNEPEKPRIQAREVAGKALKEVKNVPPSLMIYSLAGAAVVILIIAIFLVLHINRLNKEDDLGRNTVEPTPAASAAQAAQPAAPPPQALPSNSPEQEQMEQAQPVDQPAPAASAPVRAGARGKNKKKTAALPAPMVASVPGMMAIDSVPAGAQFQLDGKTDPSWVTPFTLTGLAAGAHTVTVTKAGYAADTRTVDVGSGNKAFITSHLTQLVATLSVTSTPAGANVYVDGRDTGKLTPAQVSLDKGQHVVLVRKAGFLDETTSAQFALSQSVNFSPTLRALGNIDDIHTTNKIKKLFGGKEEKTLGSVTVRTQPKGAQVAVNQHMLDKPSPVDFTLDPGNYIVDITLTGYAPIHKEITVDKGGKAVIDEAMKRE